MSLYKKLSAFLFPSYCVACGRRLLVGEETVCLHCRMSLPRTYLWLTPNDNTLTHHFLGRTDIIKGCSYIYHNPDTDTAKIIYDIKYRNRPDAARAIGYIMAQEIGASGFFDDIDVIIPVPLSPFRRRQRGYNQSEEFAKGITQAYHIPVVTNILQRYNSSASHSTQTSQTTHTAMARRDNVDGAFYVANDTYVLQDKHCLLFDDIITTGSTLLECAKMLRDIPGISVSVLTYGITNSN